jgi:hypothetical protein
MQKAQGVVSGFESKLKDLALGFGAAFATEKIISFASEAIKSAGEAIDGENRLLTALHNRTDVQERLLEQAEKIAKVTLIEDDDIIKQQAFLAALGRNEAQINKVITAAVQLSAATGTELGASVEALNKSYEGLDRGLKAIDPSLQGLTKEQLRHGEAVDMVIKKYQGFAEIAASTGSGPLLQFKKMIGEITEDIGRKLLPVVNQFLKSFTGGALRDYYSAVNALQHNGTFGDIINFSTGKVDDFNRSMAELKRIALEAGVALEGQHGPFQVGLIAPIVTDIKTVRAELTLLQKDLIDTKKLPLLKAPTLGKDSGSFSDTLPTLPDLQPNIEQLKQLNLLMDEYPNKAKFMQDATVDLTNTIVTGLTFAFISLGDAIGQAMAGVDVNFGDAILKSIASFANQMGSMLIAAGTAALVAKTMLVTNPIAAIAAGVALVAIAGAVMGSISSSAANMGGGGGGQSGGRAIDSYIKDREKINNTSWDGMQLQLTGLVGNNFNAALRKSGYQTGITGG